MCIVMKMKGATNRKSIFKSTEVMRFPRKISVELSQENNLSSEFVYDQALKRVSDLNKFSFSYRTLYATIIAAYVGALTLLADFSSSSIILPSIEVYALALHGVTLVVFAVTLVICFYDYIFQEIIERSLRAAARIEERVPGMGWGKVALISGASGSIMSLRISITMFLFYFVPAASLFAVISLTAAAVVPTQNGSVNTIMANSMCDIAAELSAGDANDITEVLDIMRAKQHLKNGLTCRVPYTDAKVVGPSDNPKVVYGPPIAQSSYSFKEPLRRVVGVGYIVAVGFLGYFFFYSGWRILSRFLRFLRETRLYWLVPEEQRLRACGLTIGWVFTVVIFATFVAGVFSSSVSQFVITTTLAFL